MHLTIARTGRQPEGGSQPGGGRQSGGSRQPGDGVSCHGDSCWPVEWDAVLDTLVLYESILKPEGAEYRVLCRSGLSGGGHLPGEEGAAEVS